MMAGLPLPQLVRVHGAHLIVPLRTGKGARRFADKSGGWSDEQDCLIRAVSFIPMFSFISVR